MIISLIVVIMAKCTTEHHSVHPEYVEFCQLYLKAEKYKITIYIKRSVKCGHV